VAVRVGIVDPRRRDVVELLARTGWHPPVEAAAVRVCASITKVARDDTS
jgi:hypothetical protein